MLLKILNTVQLYLDEMRQWFPIRCKNIKQKLSLQNRRTVLTNISVLQLINTCNNGMILQVKGCHRLKQKTFFRKSNAMPVVNWQSKILQAEQVQDELGCVWSLDVV